MARRRRFHQTLMAVGRTGATQGDIGNALRSDIIADVAAGGQPTPGMGYFEECESFLRLLGFVFDAQYLRQLYRASAITAREEWLRELDGLGDQIARWAS